MTTMTLATKLLKTNCFTKCYGVMLPLPPLPALHSSPPRCSMSPQGAHFTGDAQDFLKFLHFSTFWATIENFNYCSIIIIMIIMTIMTIIMIRNQA